MLIVVADVAHQDTLEAHQVVVAHTFAALDDAVDVNQTFLGGVTYGEVVDDLRIVLIHIVAEVLVEQGSGTEHRSLVVGRGPLVLTSHIGCLTIELHVVVHLTSVHIGQIDTLVAVERLGSVPIGVGSVVVVQRGIALSDVAGSHFSRTVDARVRLISVTTFGLGPTQQTYIAQVRTVPDEVEVAA